MAATDTGARVRATALTTIDEQCLGEDIRFDMFTGLVNENGQIIVCYTMILTKPVPLMRRGRSSSARPRTATAGSGHEQRPAVPAALKITRHPPGRRTGYARSTM